VKRDFLAITDLTGDEIHSLLELARKLKTKQKKGKLYQPLKNQTLAMIFQKPSARTRVSFEVGMYQLGGHAVYLAPADIGLGQRETASDVARVISRYCDGIMARLFSHDLIEELARFATVPVINGLTDLLHPCQILGDMLTILEHRGHLDQLKVAWVGDGNNVAHSWINIASRLPMQLHLACPRGYDPDPKLLKNARDNGVSEIRVHRRPGEAVKEADVIYTDVWTSMGQEKEKAARKKAFKGFQVNQRLVDKAKSDVLILHCLPAHRKEEITEDVLEGPRSVVFDEAENRLHIQKAIMVALMGK